MEYAVVELKNKQFLVRPGDKFVVDGEMTDKDLSAEVKVLLTKDKKVTVGQPDIKASLGLKVVEVRKSEKIRVSTFRSKSRYRRTKGHRQEQTVVEWPVAKSATKKSSPKKQASTKSEAKKTSTPKKKSKPKTKTS